VLTRSKSPGRQLSRVRGEEASHWKEWTWILLGKLGTPDYGNLLDGKKEEGLHGHQVKICVKGITTRLGDGKRRDYGGKGDDLQEKTRATFNLG